MMLSIHPTKAANMFSFGTLNGMTMNLKFGQEPAFLRDSIKHQRCAQLRMTKAMLKLTRLSRQQPATVGGMAV